MIHVIYLMMRQKWPVLQPEQIHKLFSLKKDSFFQTWPFTQREDTLKHICKNLLLSTKQGKYIFEVGAECL